MFGVTGLRFKVLSFDNAGHLVPSLRYAGWSLVYLAGHVLGGAGIGAALGQAGALPGVAPLTATLLSLFCLLWAFQEARQVPNHLPQWERQVQREWLGCRPWWFVAVGYGLQLGCAVATRIRIRTTYAALFAALATGSPMAGGLIMTCFGASRALPAIIQGPFVASPERALRCAVAIDAYQPLVVRANAALLLAVGISLAWTTLTAVAMP
jgi:hypothetical protein